MRVPTATLRAPSLGSGYREPMCLLHTYNATITWTGAGENGTRGYTAYSRDHEVAFPGKPVLAGSAEPSFRGDPARYNPEELLVGSLSQCHMLWFLHLAAADGVVVTGYVDNPVGTMRVEAAGADGLRVAQEQTQPARPVVDPARFHDVGGVDPQHRHRFGEIVRRDRT